MDRAKKWVMAQPSADDAYCATCVKELEFAEIPTSTTGSREVKLGGNRL